MIDEIKLSDRSGMLLLLLYPLPRGGIFAPIVKPRHRNKKHGHSFHHNSIIIFLLQQLLKLSSFTTADCRSSHLHIICPFISYL